MVGMGANKGVEFAGEARVVGDVPPLTHQGPQQ